MSRLVLRRKFRSPPDPFGLWATGPSGAVLSDDQQYRYLLWRRFAPNRLLPIAMLNPSTADSSVNDPTIRRCLSFAADHDYGGILVVNLSPFRATYVQDMLAHQISNAEYSRNSQTQRLVLEYAKSRKTPILCAWGTNARAMITERGTFHDIRHEIGVEAACLSQTFGGYPGHPLYLPATCKMKPFLEA